MTSLEQRFRKAHTDHADRLIDASLEEGASAEALATLAVARALLSIDARLERIGDLLEDSPSLERIAGILEGLEVADS